VPCHTRASGGWGLRLFFEIVRRSFRRQLTYRAATVAGLITNVFFGLLRASVLLALLDGTTTNGWNSSDAVTYVVLTQAIMMFVNIFGWTDLMNAVYRGEIATDLLRPMSLFGFWFAQDVGRALAALLLRGFTIILVSSLVFRIKFPSNLEQVFALLVSMVLALTVSFAFRFIVNLAAFWSPDARGFARFAFVLGMFASGFLMPLRFFPDWVQQIINLTPFPHIMNTVIEIYVGSYSGVRLLEVLAIQVFWAVALVVVAQTILTRAFKRLVILGG
jgi:ABC-2 type transport system permease protein